MIPIDVRRIIVYLGTKKNEDVSKIHELTGQSESAISKILNKEFSIEQIDEMVNLRKNFTSLHVIAKKFKTHHSRVRETLENELGDDYPKYHANNLKLSSEQINEIVRLRKKERAPLSDIAYKFNISITSAKKILKKELGDDYDKYRGSKIPDIMRTLIFHLHRKGKSMEEIADSTGISKTYIKSLICPTFDFILDKIIENLQIEFHSKVREECILLFEEIHNKIKKGTKYRDFTSLAPIIIFLFLRMRHTNVNSKTFIDAVNISRAEFRNGLKYILQNFPEYFIRNFKDIIIDNINNITNSFSLNSDFHQEAMLLLKRFLPYISNTKEEIIASVVCILTMIKLNISHIKYADVSKKAGISISSVFYQVKYNIFERLNIGGFQGFKTSRNLVENLLGTTV